MRCKFLAAVVALGLVTASCASDSASVAGDSPADATTEASAPSSTAPIEAPATTGAPSASTSSPTDAPPFTEASDLVYMTVNGAEFLMDAYTPAGEGPWPVVVSFHGLSNDGKDDSQTTVIAEEAATQGMVVFTPTWIIGDPRPISLDTVEAWDQIVSCAVAFAQQNAAEYGGDPATTVIDGFSAGAGAAVLFASHETFSDPIPGCATDASPTPVSGFVFGDVESFLYSENFDGAFDDDLDAMRARLAVLIGPASWSGNRDAKHFLWVAGDGTNPRAISDPSDESGWLFERDPDGSIQADLERLDHLTDGIVTAIDAGELLALRLTEAGFEVSLDEYPGGHVTQDKVSEIVGYLQQAANG